MEDGFQWVCSGVYGPNDDSLRNGLWLELGEVSQKWRAACGIVGDFNVVRFPSERLGCQRFSLAMLAFSDFIEEHHLIDLPLCGGSFTWSSNTILPSMSCIDQVLVLGDWEDFFSDVTQSTLPRVVSDHSPLLLEAGGMVRGRNYFKFENMWLKVEGFTDMVDIWWRGYQFEGSLSYVMACKLKALKEDLKQWNKDVFGDVNLRKKALLCELLGLDVKGGSQGLTIWEKEHQEAVQAEVEHLVALQEISWCQKSRVLWLKEGDSNTRFFHKVVNSH